MKTTLQEIINQAKVRLLKGSHHLINVGDIEALAESFQIYDITYTDDERLKSVYSKVHQCTDTWVGILVYFLDDEAVAVSFQSARKDSKDVYYISKETSDKVYNYIMSLKEETIPAVNYLTDDELITEIDDNYPVHFAEEILHTYAIYMNDVVEILSRASYNRTNDKFKDKFHGIEIKNVDTGEISIVDCRDLQFKYNQGLSEKP